MQSSILAPAAVLILWSLIVLFWVVSTRFPAFKRAGIDAANSEAGGRYQDIEAQLPPSVNWKSHNYTHLMEQPTLFYSEPDALDARAGRSTALYSDPDAPRPRRSRQHARTLAGICGISRNLFDFQRCPT